MKYTHTQVKQWVRTFHQAHGRTPSAMEMSHALNIVPNTAKYHLVRMGLDYHVVRDTNVRVYLAYVNYCRKHGQSPTYAEVGEIVGISNVAVYKHVCKLVNEGKLEFNPHQRNRGVRIKGEGSHAAALWRHAAETGF